MTQDPVTQLLDDPRFKGKPVTWEVTPEEYDAVRRAFLTMAQAGLVLYKPYTEGVFKAQVANRGEAQARRRRTKMSVVRSLPALSD